MILLSNVENLRLYYRGHPSKTWIRSMYKKWRRGTLHNSSTMYIFIGDFLQDVKRKGFTRFDWYRIAGFNSEQFFECLSMYVCMINLPTGFVTINGEEDTHKTSMAVVNTYEESFSKTAYRWEPVEGKTKGVIPKNALTLKASFDSGKDSLYANGINPIAKPSMSDLAKRAIKNGREMGIDELSEFSDE